MKKKIISALLAVSVLLTNPILVQAEDTIGYYHDVAAADWFCGYVDNVFKNSWMTGMDTNIFGPYEVLSRAQFTTILYRMEHSPEVTGEITFTDVPADAWFADSVFWAAEHQIVTGYESGEFGPADIITREQMAVMLYRYAGYKGFDLTETADLSIFPDCEGVSGFAKDAVGWCSAKGIITGSNGAINPLGETSRAECATMICRFADAYQITNISGEYIVTYAKQFLGNPYEYGGDDPYTGIDCSHFVYYVLKNCGVYDGAYTTSYGWRTRGTEVPSLEEAKAGDIICYGGHVAIYDGEGYIVEAKGEAWGITHDRKADCKTILTIRRFI